MFGQLVGRQCVGLLGGVRRGRPRRRFLRLLLMGEFAGGGVFQHELLAVVELAVIVEADAAGEDAEPGRFGTSLWL